MCAAIFPHKTTTSGCLGFFLHTSSMTFCIHIYSLIYTQYSVSRTVTVDKYCGTRSQCATLPGCYREGISQVQLEFSGPLLPDPCLWIRIHFLRIRIQLSFSLRIRIQQHFKGGSGSGSSLTKIPNK